MRLKVIHNVIVDLEKSRLNEIWPKHLQYNDILRVDKIESTDKGKCNLVLDNGDVLLDVPNDVYQIC